MFLLVLRSLLRFYGDSLIRNSLFGHVWELWFDIGSGDQV